MGSPPHVRAVPAQVDSNREAWPPAANYEIGGKAMIKVSVLYPNSEGSSFDMRYYLEKHIPMVRQKLGAPCKGVAVEQGIGGGAPGVPAAYSAMGHLYFESVEAFQAAFGPHSGPIMEDIPNYTNIQPTIQISEVRL
jgi:uncharacterized protein (TIGR02118 family)